MPTVTSVIALPSWTPLALKLRNNPRLELGEFGLESVDRTSSSSPMKLLALAIKATWVKSSISYKDTYCGTTGVEYMHIQDPEKRNWIRNKVEENRNRPVFDQR